MIDILWLAKYAGALMGILALIGLIGNILRKEIRRIHQEEAAEDKKQQEARQKEREKEKKRLAEQEAIERKELAKEEALERRELARQEAQELKELALEQACKEREEREDLEIRQKQRQEQLTLNAQVIDELQKIKEFQDTLLSGQNDICDMQAKLVKRHAELEAMTLEQEDQIEDSKEQRRLLLNSLHALLVSFEKMGFNGPVGENKIEIETYFRDKATK